MLQPPGIAGGDGFTFADAVSSLYLVALLGDESAPGLDDRRVNFVALERANFGDPLDDLIIDGVATDGSPARLGLQIKRELTISAAARNTDFQDVVHKAWETLGKPEFREEVDRVGTVTGTIAEGSRRAFIDICEWARASASDASFFARFKPGISSQEHRDALDAVRILLTRYPSGSVGDDAVFRLLRHFVLIRVDVLHEGSTDDRHAIERLRLRLEETAQAESLWRELRTISRDAAGRAAEFDRSRLLAKLGGRFRFKAGTVSTVIAADADKTITAVPVPAAETARGTGVLLDLAAVRALAEKLLRDGTPPSLLPLFPHASGTARRALDEFGQVRRTVSRPEQEAAKQQALAIVELATTEELQHLVLAPPGSGKTHAVWRAARVMLDRGALVPLFIPLGRFVAWDDVVAEIASNGTGTDVAALLRDTRVCVFLDGWSEFAGEQASRERAHALRALGGARVIANGRRGASDDIGFRIWMLDPPPTDAVAEAVRIAFPAGPQLSAPLIDLLRLPLALSLFILLGGAATTRGELLARMHAHLSEGFPSGFREAVAGAVASLILRMQGRPYARFENELRERTASAAIAEPETWLKKLGTLEDWAGSVVPVHDLYWSWLGGVGLLSENRIAASLPRLATRECFELALESGAVPQVEMVAAAADKDITLAAQLSESLGAPDGNGGPFNVKVEALFVDSELPVRSRAALAALRSGRAHLLRRALDILTEVHDAGLYLHAFDAALVPEKLYPNRGIVAGWIGANGTERLTDAIAARGDECWEPWLRQMIEAGKLDMPLGVAAALACKGCLPAWTVEHLPDLIRKACWKLHAVSARSANAELADWIAEHYEEFAQPGNGAWWHLNKVLVSCGSEATFERLLARFSGLPSGAQDPLGFAVVARGEPWIARFQQVAFVAGAPRQHHELGEAVSLGIDDATARQWIAQEPAELGWRVLILRRGAAVVPEMVAALPSSFAGQHLIPALSAMRFLEDPPASLADELMRRIASPMQPRATQDLINALTRVKPLGIVHVGLLLRSQPLAMPLFFVGQILRLLREWEKENKQAIQVRSQLSDMSFAEWILSIRLPQDRGDLLYPRILAGEPEVAVKLVLGPLRDDEKVIAEVIGQMQPLTEYRADLYDLLLANPKLAALAFKLFSGAFESFPEAALLRAVDAPGVEFDALLRALATAGSPSHVALHQALIQKTMSKPLDLFAYREMATILRVHPRSELLALLKGSIPMMTSNAKWFVREVEGQRGELLIDEAGAWLA